MQLAHVGQSPSHSAFPPSSSRDGLRDTLVEFARLADADVLDQVVTLAISAHLHPLYRQGLLEVSSMNYERRLDDCSSVRGSG
jgi:hypothetical protein